MPRFSDRKGLTKKLNLKGWKIYRDSDIGLYALNEELGIDHCLLTWNITLDDPELDRKISWIRKECLDLEKDNN